MCSKPPNDPKIDAVELSLLMLFGVYIIVSLLFSIVVEGLL